ncbi:MAG: prolipoprotein diacylglyceryl transferase, partial [Planctomycetota bacterium]
MRRVLFEIPGLHWPIFGYGTMVLVGFLAGTWLLRRGARARGWDSQRTGDLAIWMVLFGLAGARIFYFVQFYSEEFQDRGLLAILRIWEGGLVFYGGILGGLITFFLLTWKHRLPVRAHLDLLAPAIAIGLGFGRIGCFLNGCCWGMECAVDFPLGVVFPAESLPASAAQWRGLGDPGAPLHPTQLYAALNALLLAWLMWRLNHLRLPPGVTAGAFILLYGISRFLLEQIRGDHQTIPGTWPVSQT